MKGESGKAARILQILRQQMHTLIWMHKSSAPRCRPFIRSTWKCCWAVLQKSIFWLTLDQVITYTDGSLLRKAADRTNLDSYPEISRQ